MLSIIKFRFLLLLITFFALTFTACSYKDIDSNMSQEMVDFKFITQDNEEFGLEDLKGDWWVANFMYTDCTIICPTTTPNMAIVQDMTNKLNLDIQLISFSVDPDNDTPKVLKEFVKDYPIDLSNWHFLTGYDFDEIRNLSNNSFRTVLEGGGPEEHAFIHSTYFFLINPKGEIIKKYDGMSSKAMDQIVKDLDTVL